jgi:hypothetical protein
MKHAFFISLLLVVFQIRAAEEIVHQRGQSCVFKVYQTEKPLNVPYLKTQLKKYEHFKIAGVSLMCVGAVAFVAGEAMLITSSVMGISGQSRYNDSSRDPLWRAGIACSFIGVGGLGAGIPLYLIGKKRSKRIKRQLASVPE